MSDPDDDDTLTVGSCDDCGCDLDDDDGSNLCGSCSWWLGQSGE